MAVTLHDGPADGKTFNIRLAPGLLRVAINPDGIRTVERLTDDPELGEITCVYKLRGVMGPDNAEPTPDPPSGRVHLHFAGKTRAPGGFYATADYDYLLTVDSVYCIGADWLTFSEELAAQHFPDLMDAMALADASDRVSDGHDDNGSVWFEDDLGDGGGGNGSLP